MNIKRKIYIDILVFLGLMIFAGLISVALGMDRSPDVMNYHIYNPYAFLADRLSVDFMPASC